MAEDYKVGDIFKPYSGDNYVKILSVELSELGVTLRLYSAEPIYISGEMKNRFTMSLLEFRGWVSDCYTKCEPCLETEKTLEESNDMLKEEIKVAKRYKVGDVFYSCSGFYYVEILSIIPEKKDACFEVALSKSMFFDDDFDVLYLDSKTFSDWISNFYEKMDVKPNKESNDMVVHPKHYNTGKFEPIDVIADWGLSFNLGNTVKYISRCNHKGKKLEDLKKAAYYLQYEIERLEKEGE